jgi:hypothetical protein
VIAGCFDRRKKMCICLVFRLFAQSNNNPTRTRKTKLLARALPLPTPLPTLQIHRITVCSGIHTRRSKEKTKREEAFGADQLLSCAQVF